MMFGSFEEAIKLIRALQESTHKALVETEEGVDLDARASDPLLVHLEAKEQAFVAARMAIEKRLEETRLEYEEHMTCRNDGAPINDEPY